MVETQKTGSSLWNCLKCLCSAYGWSYAIFWRCHPPDSLFLSVEDAYYEGQLGQEITKTVPQLNFLGEGIVGQVAFTGKPRWIFSDAQTQEWNLTGVLGGLDHCELDSDLRQQFSSGIKTIAVISVKPLGVVQFGSAQKILEREEILEQAQRLFMETDNLDTVDAPANMVLPWDFENYDLNGSLTSEHLCSWNLSPEDDNNISEGMRNACFSTNMDNSLLSTYKNQEDGMTSLHGESSCLSDQLTTAAEAQVVLPEKDSFEVPFNPNSYVKNPCFGTWSSEVSLASSMAQDVTAEDSVLTSLYSMNTSMLGSGGSFEDKLGNPMEDNPFAQSLHGLSKISTEDLAELCSVDDLCQRFASSPEHSACATNNTALENSLSQSLEFNPSCVALSGDPLKNLSDGHQTSTLMHTFEDNTALDFVGECWGNMIAPMMKSAANNASPECKSELNTVMPNNATKKGLFAELGIEELLNGGSSFEDQISTTKRRRTGSSGSTNPVSNLDKTNHLVHKEEIFPKSVVGSWMDHSHCFNGVKVVPQKPEESTKVSRKRARPGESTRPRPKDRQQIQDRIKELRGIIPSGGKCSIDSLLDRTIKYMLFLQSVTKYADKLQEPESPKLIEEANSMVAKNKSVGESDIKGGGGGGGGVTWAFEVAGQKMACPIIVEDMNQPGQMLIEMLCEEQGLFLEIAEIIRGFGLNILKGKMEIRDNKLWGRFIVEASRHVTRVDVFWYLVQLLPQTNASGMDNYQETDMALPAMAMT